MYKAVIFDLWETLATKNVGISKRLADHFGMTRDKEFVHSYEEAIQLKKWGSKQDMAKNFLDVLGLDNSQESIQFVVDTLQIGIDKATLIEGVKDLLEKLKYVTKLGLLSNTTNFESDLLPRLGIADLFEATLFSWEIGTLKPDQKNFEEILNRLGVEANDSIFIDDNQVNVRAAEEFDIKGIQFQGSDQIIGELTKLGVM